MYLSHLKLATLIVCILIQTRPSDSASSSYNSFHVEQCLAKIVDVIQICSQKAIENWNLNNSMFIPSNLSTCCANWEVFDCFVQASLEYCSLVEFQAVVNNMTSDALFLQRTNCSRFKYHSEVCSMFSLSFPLKPDRFVVNVLIALVVSLIYF